MKQRVITAALLIPPVLLAVFLSNPVPISALAAVAFFIGYAELSRLQSGPRRIPVVGVLGIAALFYVAARGAGREDAIDRALFCYILILAECIGFIGIRLFLAAKKGWFVTEASSLWLWAGLTALAQLKLAEANSDAIWRFASTVLLALVPLWIGDTLAIFAGKAFGKHPLAPKISPKKTVEGGIANLLGCIGGAIGIAALIHEPLLVGVFVGVATGVLGQAGDLLESAMKRSAGVKDSGTLLPGHGGLLDRIDSILLSAPVVALIVVSLGR